MNFFPNLSIWSSLRATSPWVSSPLNHPKGVKSKGKYRDLSIHPGKFRCCIFCWHQTSFFFFFCLNSTYFAMLQDCSWKFRSWKNSDYSFMQINIVLATDFYEHSGISTKYVKFKQMKNFRKIPAVNKYYGKETCVDGCLGPCIFLLTPHP